MHSSMHSHSAPEADAAHATSGLVMNLGWRYDIMVGLFDTLVFRGRLKGLQQSAVELARLRPGHAVLDVGCGTGTLALAVKQHVGAAGRVAGIDPGPRQIARARAKAERRGLDVDFRVGVIENLPYTDGSFDVVLSTLMMHHLPDDAKRRGLAEIARVLRPGGRVVVVDFRRRERGAGEAASLSTTRRPNGRGFGWAYRGDLSVVYRAGTALSFDAPRAHLATSRVCWPGGRLATSIPNRHQVSRNAPAPRADLAQ